MQPKQMAVYLLAWVLILIDARIFYRHPNANPNPSRVSKFLYNSACDLMEFALAGGWGDGTEEVEQTFWQLLPPEETTLVLKGMED